MSLYRERENKSRFTDDHFHIQSDDPWSYMRAVPRIVLLFGIVVLVGAVGLWYFP